MAYSKLQFIQGAFEELGMADYVFDLSSESLQGALRRLDSMMAQWNAQGLRVGYPLTSSPQNSDIDADTGVPDSANEAIVLNLAVRLAPSYGKTVSPDTKMNAKQSYRAAIKLESFPQEQQLPGGYPLGSGNKNWTGIVSPFTQMPVDITIDQPDEELGFN